MMKDPHALVIPDGTKTIEESQYKGTDYEKVFVPKSVAKIRNYAFEDCKSLK